MQIERTLRRLESTKMKARRKPKQVGPRAGSLAAKKSPRMGTNVLPIDTLAQQSVPNVEPPERVGNWKRLRWMLLTIAVAMIWAYWSTFAHLVRRWSIEPEYSHGFVVPIFALTLLWVRREQVLGKPMTGHWAGLVLVAIGASMRIASTYWFYTLAGALTLLPVLAGLAIVIGGWRAWRWAWPSIMFLVFMIPLPSFVSSAMALPLQRIATICSTYVLQLLGIPAVAFGNVIFLRNFSIGVVEACSGLRMLILFFAVSTAVAMLVRRRTWERVLLIVSAVPIALCVNIARITITGILYEMVSPVIADQFFHDVAGWLMGPSALCLLWLEMKFLDHALVRVNERPVTLHTLASGGA